MRFETHENKILSSKKKQKYLKQTEKVRAKKAIV